MSQNDDDDEEEMLAEVKRLEGLFSNLLWH